MHDPYVKGAVLGQTDRYEFHAPLQIERVEALWGYFSSEFVLDGVAGVRFV